MTCSLSLATLRYSIETRRRKHVKGHGFSSLARNISNKYGQKLLDTTTKTRLHALKAASENIHKAAEATGEFMGNKITEKNVKPEPVSDENLREFEEIIIPPVKRKDILNKLGQLL